MVLIQVAVAVTIIIIIRGLKYSELLAYDKVFNTIYITNFDTDEIIIYETKPQRVKDTKMLENAEYRTVSKTTKKTVNDKKEMKTYFEVFMIFPVRWRNPFSRSIKYKSLRFGVYENYNDAKIDAKVIEDDLNVLNPNTLDYKIETLNLGNTTEAIEYLKREIRQII